MSPFIKLKCIYLNIKLGVLLKFLNTDSDIFIRTSEIIFEKRSYSDVAASRYFDTLFHDSFTPEFSPEKLIHLYNRNIDLLKKIYAFELWHGQSVDYDGRYLEAFIRSDDSWIDVYTEYLFDHEYASGVSYSESSRMKILWCTDQWMGYCDHIFEAEVNTDPVSSFRNRRILKDVMGHFYQEENVVSRQKEWFLHLIDVYAQSDAIKTVFFISADLPDDFRLQMFSRFLQQNKEADMFKLLPLEPDSQMCTDSREPVLTRQKEFLLSLQRMTTGVEYLEHNSYLQEQIDQKDRQIKYARLDDMVREVYD